MPKKVINISKFKQGIHNSKNARDIPEDAIADGLNIMTDIEGKVRQMARDKLYPLTSVINKCLVVPGYGLFTFANDYSHSQFDGDFDDGFEVGTVAAYSGTTITLASSPSYVTSTKYALTDFFDNWTILITSGNGAGQTRTITAWNRSNQQATIAALGVAANTASKYALFRWESTGFGNNDSDEWITDGSGDDSFLAAGDPSNPIWGKYHLISKTGTIGNNNVDALGYIELKGSGDSGKTVSALTIKPGVQYYFSFWVRASNKYFSYVSNAAIAEKVPWIQLYHTDIDGSGTNLALFANNTWIEDAQSQTNPDTNIVTNGDFETGIENTSIVSNLGSTAGASAGSVTLTVDGTAATDANSDQKLFYKNDGTVIGICTSRTDNLTIVFANGTSNDVENDVALYTLTGWEAVNAARTDIIYTLITSNEYGGAGNTLKMAAGSSFAYLANTDPNSYIYQDITCDDNQLYHLNFVHSSDEDGIAYAVLDTTADPEVYLVPWTTTTSTGAITTYKFVNQTSDSLGLGGKMTTEYTSFFVEDVGGATTRTIRIMFSCSGSGTSNCCLDGVTVFKAFPDLVTMSHKSEAASPYSNAMTGWNEYSFQFKLPVIYAEKSDWVLRVHGGKAVYGHDGSTAATGSANTHTIEFDNIRLESEESDNLIMIILQQNQE